MVYPGIGKNKGPFIGPAIGLVFFALMVHWWSGYAAIIVTAVIWVMAILPLYSYPHKWHWSFGRTVKFMLLGWVSIGYVFIYTAFHNPNSPYEDPDCFYDRQQELDAVNP